MAMFLTFKWQFSGGSESDLLKVGLKSDWSLRAQIFLDFHFYGIHLELSKNQFLYVLDRRAKM